MKAAPMTQKPSFPLMKQGDVQNIYHLQMPRWLFTDTKYMELALETKVAYTFLLNRFQLSRLNGWVNEDGAVFIIYTRRSLAEEMQVSYRKIIEAMKELTAAGLIWEKRCGRGDANQIYLALIEHPEPKSGSAPFVPPEHEAAGGEPEAGPEEAGGDGGLRSAESAPLISLNTFEMKPIEINRYDIDGQMIEEAIGAVSLGGGASKDGGFSATVLLDYDRGYATGSMEFHDDKTLDIDKAVTFLCAECLNEILPQDIEQCFGVGVISLATKEIHIQWA